MSILERIRAFNHHILQSGTTAPEIQKTMLQSKVLDILEDEKNIEDILRYPGEIQAVPLFIESAGFGDDQKRLIYKRLFSAMAGHPDALFFFSNNPDFPYSEENKNTIADLLAKGHNCRLHLIHQYQP